MDIITYKNNSLTKGVTIQYKNDADVDEVGLWKRVLSEVEIRYLYNGGKNLRKI